MPGKRRDDTEAKRLAPSGPATPEAFVYTCLAGLWSPETVGGCRVAQERSSIRRKSVVPSAPLFRVSARPRP